MKILYTSNDVHKAIKKVFATRHKRRVAVVAYLGEKAEEFLPNPEGVQIICCPEPGATSPTSVRSLLARGAEVQFSDDLHAKVYWSEGGCVITSANISNRALSSRSNQKEAGVLIDSDDFDIDRLIKEVKPYEITKKNMNSLDKKDKNIRKTLGIKRQKTSEINFLNWHNSPFREAWKIGWWSDYGDIAKSSKERAKQEYNVSDPDNYINVSKSSVKENEWLLLFEITENNIQNIEWMYVDFVEPVHPKDTGAYEKDWPYQAIQVRGLKSYPLPPFKIEKAFETAFKKAALEYGTDKIENLKSLVPPKPLIKSLVKHYHRR